MIKYKLLSDKKWLEEQIKTKPMRHIAKELGCSYAGVNHAVKKFNIVIPKRTGYVYTEETRKKKSESQKAAYKKKFPNGRFGELHTQWKGGRQKVGGYIAIHSPGHPRAGRANRVFEHILVVEKELGRYLSTDEIVHHINGNKLDNRIENLEVTTRSKHFHEHYTDGEALQKLHNRINYLQDLLDENHIKY